MSLFPPNKSTNPAGRLGRWSARRGEDCHGCRRGMLRGGSRYASRVALGLMAVLVTSSPAAATVVTHASATTTTHTLTVTKTLIVSESNADSRSSLVTYEASKAGIGASVTSSPAGIDCGATCSAQFADGTAVTLTATAEGVAGLSFDAWDGDCRGSGSGTCVLTIDRDRAVTAVFVEYFRPGLPAHCHVPKVVGMLLRKAMVRITHAHCRPGKVIRRPSSKARRNHVLAQSPKPGRTLRQGTPVNLTVGKSPKKK
jgi:hypothetical protein